MVEIKKKELRGIKDFESFLARLGELHEAKWVAVLDDGEIVATDTVQELYSVAENKSQKIVIMFRASKKNEMLLV